MQITKQKKGEAAISNLENNDDSSSKIEDRSVETLWSKSPND